MKQKLLLSLVLAGFFVGANAQKKPQRTTAYAITGVQKGSDRWTEVRLVDVKTGEEINPVYQSSQEVAVLNARTGKPIVKKDVPSVQPATTEYRVINKGNNEDVIIIKTEGKETVTIIRNDKSGNEKMHYGRVMIRNSLPVQTDKPFATNSAACAYDKKHDRLYYTPMGINQLRYIDLKSKESKIFFFEDEPFGVLAHRHDVANQITRMVIASDGNGYALTNNAQHLIRFTTNRKAVITDLGAITDDAANGENSILNRGGYGGDIVADDKENLYLVTANRNVFKISIKDLKATWLGVIKGLPRGYTTNGAVVEKGTSIIVNSSNTTYGFYKFDLETMEAQKVSTNESVFRASDLANANLISTKKKDETPQETAKTANPLLEEKRELAVKYKLSAYPNPAAKGGVVNLSFNDFPQGRYQVQLVDLSGKLLSAENINVGGRMQLHLLQLPKSLAHGTYMVKVVGDANKEKALVTEQVVVQ